jgi:hypothetical protein
MTPELDQKLVKDFPLLYTQRDWSMSHTLMCWGFPEDGWEPLIRELSDKIETYNRQNLPNEPVQAVQVKEKFGGLRFYVYGGTEEIWDLIDEAEEKSFTICEFCGKPGKPRATGWIKTLCDECYEKL